MDTGLPAKTPNKFYSCVSARVCDALISIEQHAVGTHPEIHLHVLQHAQSAVRLVLLDGHVQLPRAFTRLEPVALFRAQAFQEPDPKQGEHNLNPELEGCAHKISWTMHSATKRPISKQAAIPGLY